MLTMVLIAAAGLMFTMFLMRRTSAGTRRDRADGIRWRGIDWSQEAEPPKDDPDHFKKSQD